MWYAVHDATGKLVSQGSSPPDSDAVAALGLLVKSWPERPAALWNEATADFDIPRPVRRMDRDEFFRNIPVRTLAKIITEAKADARVEAWLMKLRHTESVDQTDTWFRGGIRQMVDAGVITAAEAAAIRDWT